MSSRGGLITTKCPTSMICNSYSLTLIMALGTIILARSLEKLGSIISLMAASTKGFSCIRILLHSYGGFGWGLLFTFMDELTSSLGYIEPYRCDVTNLSDTFPWLVYFMYAILPYYLIKFFLLSKYLIIVLSPSMHGVSWGCHVYPPLPTIALAYHWTP